MEQFVTKIRQLIAADEFQPVIEKALGSAQDLASAAALLASNIVTKIAGTTDLPDEQLWGDDGLADYALDAIFAYAQSLGLPGADDPEQAQKAEDVVRQNLQGEQPGPAQAPEQMPPQGGRPLMAG